MSKNIFLGVTVIMECSEIISHILKVSFRPLIALFLDSRIIFVKLVYCLLFSITCSFCNLIDFTESPSDNFSVSLCPSICTRINTKKSFLKELFGK